MSQDEGPFEGTATRARRRLLPSVSEIVRVLSAESPEADPGLVYRAAREVCKRELERLKDGLDTAPVEVLVQRAAALMKNPRAIVEELSVAAEEAPFAPAAPLPTAAEIFPPASQSSRPPASDDPFGETLGALDLRWSDGKEFLAEEGVTPVAAASAPAPSTVILPLAFPEPEEPVVPAFPERIEAEVVAVAAVVEVPKVTAVADVAEVPKVVAVTEVPKVTAVADVAAAVPADAVPEPALVVLPRGPEAGPAPDDGRKAPLPAPTEAPEPVAAPVPPPESPRSSPAGADQVAPPSPEPAISRWTLVGAVVLVLVAAAGGVTLWKQGSASGRGAVPTVAPPTALPVATPNVSPSVPPNVSPSVPASVPSGPATEPPSPAASPIPRGPVSPPAALSAAPPQAVPTVLPTALPAAPAARAPQVAPAAAPQTRAGGFASAECKGKAVYVLHFSSYRERATAERDAGRIGKSLDVPVRAVSVDLGEKGTWYRVVAGEFETADEAMALRRRLEEARTPNLGLVYRMSPK